MNSQMKLASWLLFLFVALCAFSLTAHSQSGRRQTKPAPSAPVPTPTPEPTPTPKEETQSDLSVLVGMDRSDMYNYFPMSYYSIVLESCAARIGRGSNVKVTTSNHLSRADAVKAAKAQQKGYVVWLRLAGSTMDPSQYVRDSQIEIEYVVFAPGTAKIATSGRTYQNANRKGPVVVQPPGGSNNQVYVERMLERAAEDAAERILKALHLSSGNLAFGAGQELRAKS